MEQQDDFESLLKSAAERYGKESLSEHTVSHIIDEKLAENKQKLRAAFKREVLVILACLFSMTSILTKTFTTTYPYQLPILIVLRVGVVAGLIYLAGSMLLFLRLMKVAQLQKDKGIRHHLQDICTKTERAIITYIWISTIASALMIGIFFTGFTTLSWYWIAPATIISGVVIYYLNIMYTNKRFGKQLQAMQLLLNEFKDG